MIGRKAFIFFLFSFCVLAPLVFSYNYPGQKWDSNPSYYINRDLDTYVCPGAESAVIRAGATWSNVSEQSFRLSWAGSTGRNYDSSGRDSLSVVGYKDFGATDRGGVSTIWFGAISGQIVECDTAFNTYYAWSAWISDYCPSDRYDVQNVATHELGHWLRLDHAGDLEATMYRSTQPGETTKRSLESDDIAGIRHIYGTGGGGGDKPYGGCGRSPATAPENDEFPKKRS